MAKMQKILSSFEVTLNNIETQRKLSQLSEIDMKTLHSHTMKIVMISYHCYYINTVIANATYNKKILPLPRPKFNEYSNTTTTPAYDNNNDNNIIAATSTKHNAHCPFFLIITTMTNNYNFSAPTFTHSYYDNYANTPT